MEGGLFETSENFPLVQEPQGPICFFHSDKSLQEFDANYSSDTEGVSTTLWMCQYNAAFCSDCDIILSAIEVLRPGLLEVPQNEIGLRSEGNTVEVFIGKSLPLRFKVLGQSKGTQAVYLLFSRRFVGTNYY